MCIATRGKYRRYVLLRGIVNDFDDEYTDIDLAEMDTRAYGMRQTLDKIQPNRDPQLEVDYLGITGDIEMIYNFKTTWMDREGDLYDYLDDVQSEIESEMEVLITERQMLGTKEI